MESKILQCLPVFTWLLPEKGQIWVFIRSWQSSGYRNRWGFLHALFIKFALFNFLFVKIKKGGRVEKDIVL